MAEVRSLRWATALFMVALGTWPVLSSADPEQRTAVIGEPAPTFSVRMRSGVWQSWGDFVGSNGIVLVFATRPDGQILKKHTQRFKELKQRGMTTLIIDVSCQQDLVRCRGKTFERDGIPIRADPRGDLVSLFEVTHTPFAVVVNGEQEIKFLGGLGKSALQTQSVFDSFASIAAGQLPAISTMPMRDESPLMRRCR